MPRGFTSAPSMTFVNAAEAQRLNATALKGQQKPNEPKAGGPVKPGTSGTSGSPHRFF
jgi:hypothetical protein